LTHKRPLIWWRSTLNIKIDFKKKRWPE